MSSRGSRKKTTPAVKLPTRSRRKEKTEEEESPSKPAKKNAVLIHLSEPEVRVGNNVPSQIVKTNDLSTDGETNVLKCLDQLHYGLNRRRCVYIKSMRDNLVSRSITQLTGADYAGRFTRRITALSWHPKYPYILASASKFGDIMFISGIPNDKPSASELPINFITKAELQGGGKGYSVTAMKFHDIDMHTIYRSSIDCTVAKVDLVRADTTVFHNTGDYNRWFCALDINCPKNMIIAGDNKGLAYQFSLDGKLSTSWRLHKNKIHHCEFNKQDPNILVTSSLDKTDAVRIWDIRSLRSENSTDAIRKPLHSLEHSAGLNCAKFNPVDGSRLLTSDQLDEIRIYQGPLWGDYVTIKHWHKQFQHITPIKADWHPLNDYIVIGRYPVCKADPKKRDPRAIDFFDSYSGKLIDAIYPPLDEICSLNVFNPTGEYLATGMNSKLVLWRPEITFNGGNLQSKSTNAPLSEATRNILRGRRAREFSPATSDDDEDTSSKKPATKRAKTTKTVQQTSSPATAASKNSNRSSRKQK